MSSRELDSPVASGYYRDAIAGCHFLHGMAYRNDGHTNNPKADDIEWTQDCLSVENHLKFVNYHKLYFHAYAHKTNFYINNAKISIVNPISRYTLMYLLCY